MMRLPDADESRELPPFLAGEDGVQGRPVGSNHADQALEQSVDGYYELDRAYRYRRVNEAGARLAGLPAAAMLGRHVLDLFPQIAGSNVHAAVSRVMAGGPPEQVEVFYAPLRIWGVNSIYPLSEGVAIFSRDITAQKLLEQKLVFLAKAGKILSSSLDHRRTLRSVTKLAVPHIADWCAVDLVSASGTIDLLAVAHVDPKKVRWASELRRLTPLDPDAPTGVPNVVRTGRPEFYPDITDEMLVAAAKDAESLALIRSIGFSSVLIVPLLARRKAIGALTFVAAESGRRYTTVDLDMAQELASRAAVAIENSRLYAEARQAVAIRDDFISVASHELRTPVTSLKIFTEVLRRQAEKRDDDQGRRQLERMNAQIDRLSALIGDLLDVSKLESGKLDLRRDPIAVDALVTDVVDAIQPMTPTHQIAVMGSVARCICGDRDRLGQVLTNLLTNATKYSPAADRVHVRLIEGPEAAMIEVEDFGIGIGDEHLAHIFDRFYRASGPDEKTFPGLGIGLYIADQIVRRHGGAMAVTSRQGSGSVFRVTLPYAAPGAAR